jgi:hypothetical protein
MMIDDDTLKQLLRIDDELGYRCVNLSTRSVCTARMPLLANQISTSRNAHLALLSISPPSFA